jgi:hypothetical protein
MNTYTMFYRIQLYDDWCPRILLLRSSNPRRLRKTRAENRSNHSAAPANFRQKASCVSQKRHPSSHLVLLRPGHPMSTPRMCTTHWLCRGVSSATHTYTIQSGRVVRSPCDRACRSEVTKKQIGEDAESKIWATWFLTRLYPGHVLDWARRKSSRVAQCGKCGCSYLEMKSALSASEIHRKGGTLGCNQDCPFSPAKLLVLQVQKFSGTARSWVLSMSHIAGGRGGPC